MKVTFVKPAMEVMTLDELQDLIVAYASCPNCYNGCNYKCW